LYSSLRNFDWAGSYCLLKCRRLGVLNISEAFTLVDFDPEDSTEWGKGREEERFGYALRRIGVFEKAMA